MSKALDITLHAEPVGSDAVMIYLSEPVRDDYPIILNALSQSLPPKGIIDCVIAYRSMLIMFDDCLHDLKSLIDTLTHALISFSNSNRGNHDANVIRIPVCYEGEYAPDLLELAGNAGMSTESVIAAHTGCTYNVCCLGFIPGFAFLGYVDRRIETPRRSNPRAAVAAGSVGIAGRQTGVYPSASPGGWNIIGRTPMKLYDLDSELYSRFTIGDTVEFFAIRADEWGDYCDA